MDNYFNSNDSFKNSYLEVLKARLTLASLEVESANKDFSSASQAINMMGLNDALKYAIDNNQDFYDNYKFLDYIQEIVKLVTIGEIEKFRTAPVEVIGSNVKRTSPCYIRQELLNAINNYKYQKDIYLNKVKSNNLIDLVTMEDELFYFEAQLHINFLRIHPFEDGNGRTARILLAVNLLNNNHAPCIITKETKSLYCSYIEHNDINNMAKLLKSLSLQEKENMESIYNNFVDNNLSLKLKKTE